MILLSTTTKEITEIVLQDEQWSVKLSDFDEMMERLNHSPLALLIAKDQANGANRFS